MHEQCSKAEGVSLGPLTDTVHDIRLHERRAPTSLKKLAPVMKGAFVAPIADQKWLHRLIVICATRAMDRERARKAIRILKTIVAMVPGCPVLSSFERVREIISWGYGTLCDSVDTVHFHRMELAKTMPMDRRTIPFQLVDHRDPQCITPARLNPRTWVLAIEDLTIGLVVAIRIDPSIRDCQSVL